MQVTIKIPQSILDIILEAGYDEDQALKLFKGYIDSIVHHPYGQFHTDFENWFDSEEEEIIQELLK
jgi:hypothetical protein